MSSYSWSQSVATKKILICVTFSESDYELGISASDSSALPYFTLLSARRVVVGVWGSSEPAVCCGTLAREIDEEESTFTFDKERRELQVELTPYVPEVDWTKLFLADDPQPAFIQEALIGDEAANEETRVGIIARLSSEEFLVQVIHDSSRAEQMKVKASSCRLIPPPIRPIAAPAVYDDDEEIEIDGTQQHAPVSLSKDHQLLFKGLSDDGAAQPLKLGPKDTVSRVSKCSLELQASDRKFQFKFSNRNQCSVWFCALQRAIEESEEEQQQSPLALPPGRSRANTIDALNQDFDALDAIISAKAEQFVDPEAESSDDKVVAVDPELKSLLDSSDADAAVAAASAAFDREVAAARLAMRAAAAKAPLSMSGWLQRRKKLGAAERLWFALRPPRLYWCTSVPAEGASLAEHCKGHCYLDHELGSRVSVPQATTAADLATFLFVIEAGSKPPPAALINSSSAPQQRRMELEAAASADRAAWLAALSAACAPSAAREAAIAEAEAAAAAAANVLYLHDHPQAAATESSDAARALRQQENAEDLRRLPPAAAAEYVAVASVSRVFAEMMRPRWFISDDDMKQLAILVESNSESESEEEHSDSAPVAPADAESVASVESETPPPIPLSLPTAQALEALVSDDVTDFNKGAPPVSNDDAALINVEDLEAEEAWADVQDDSSRRELGWSVLGTPRLTPQREKKASARTGLAVTTTAAAAAATWSDDEEEEEEQETATDDVAGEEESDSGSESSHARSSSDGRSSPDPYKPLAAAAAVVPLRTRDDGSGSPRVVSRSRPQPRPVAASAAAKEEQIMALQRAHSVILDRRRAVGSMTRRDSAPLMRASSERSSSSSGSAASSYPTAEAATFDALVAARERVRTRSTTLRAFDFGETVGAGDAHQVASREDLAVIERFRELYHTACRDAVCAPVSAIIQQISATLAARRPLRQLDISSAGVVASSGDGLRRSSSSSNSRRSSTLTSGSLGAGARSVGLDRADAPRISAAQIRAILSALEAHQSEFFDASDGAAAPPATASSRAAVLGLRSLRLPAELLGRLADPADASLITRFANSARQSLRSLHLVAVGLRSRAAAIQLGRSLASTCPLLAALDVSENDDLGCAGLHGLMTSLKASKSLRAIRARFCGLEKLGLQRLQEFFDVNGSLRRFEIGYNKLTDDGVVAFCEASKNASSLRAVELSGVNMRLKGAQALCRWLSLQHQLQELRCAWNALDDAAFHIGKALALHQSLNVLDMSRCGLKSSASYIFMGAAASPQLRSLHIGRNALSARAQIDLLDMLNKGNCPLEELGIRECSLAQKMIASLCKAVLEHRTLVYLDLALNQVKDRAAEFLTQLVARGPARFTRLHLFGTQLSKKSLSSLFHALRLNNYLTCLHLDGFHKAKGLLLNLTVLVIRPTSALAEVTMRDSGVSSDDVKSFLGELREAPFCSLKILHLGANPRIAVTSITNLTAYAKNLRERNPAAHIELHFSERSQAVLT